MYMLRRNLLGARNWRVSFARNLVHTGFEPARAIIDGQSSSAFLSDEDVEVHYDSDDEITSISEGMLVSSQSGRQALSAVLKESSQLLTSGLYMVATPIGNLEDITLRALRVLSAADTIFAEDCRRTRTLLNVYGVSANLRSYHMHNEGVRSSEVVALLKQGQVVALVSDAGTPGISDPGSVAVAAVIEAGFRVIPIPGPVAAVSALIGSGLSTREFQFVGFLPSKTAARKKQLQSLRQHVQVCLDYTNHFSPTMSLSFCCPFLFHLGISYMFPTKPEAIAPTRLGSNVAVTNNSSLLFV